MPTYETAEQRRRRLERERQAGRAGHTSPDPKSDDDGGALTVGDIVDALTPSSDSGSSSDC